MEQKKYNIILDQDIMNAVEGHYSSQGKGLSRMVSNWFILRRTILPGMYGLFTRDELTAIIISQNGVQFDMKLAVKDVIIFNLHDCEKHDRIISSTGSDEDTLIRKIERLSHAECIFLVDEIWRFWNIKSAYGTPRPNAEAFLKDWGAK